MHQHVNGKESWKAVQVCNKSEALDQPIHSRAKHVLGRGPNTTPSLYKSSALGGCTDGRGGSPQVNFIEGGDAPSGVSGPVSGVD